MASDGKLKHPDAHSEILVNPDRWTFGEGANKRHPMAYQSCGNEHNGPPPEGSSSKPSDSSITRKNTAYAECPSSTPQGYPPGDCASAMRMIQSNGAEEAANTCKRTRTLIACKEVEPDAHSPISPHENPCNRPSSDNSEDDVILVKSEAQGEAKKVYDVDREDSSGDEVSFIREEVDADAFPTPKHSFIFHRAATVLSKEAAIDALLSRLECPICFRSFSRPVAPTLIGTERDQQNEAQQPSTSQSIGSWSEDRTGELRVTKCGHIFCAHCVVRAVKDRKRCPTCNQTLTANQISPLFF